MRTWKPRRPVVLVVDDDPDILRVLCMCLSSEGCDVREASSGSVALTMLTRVDVMVVDQRMPNVCSMDLVANARAQGFSGRVLVISGHRNLWAEMSLSLIDGFLAKPIGSRELLKEVERLFYMNVPMCRPIDRLSRTSVAPTKA